jgi:hypothetical protein
MRQDHLIHGDLIRWTIAVNKPLYAALDIAMAMRGGSIAGALLSVPLRLIVPLSAAAVGFQLAV